jgi:hypothetical protein
MGSWQAGLGCEERELAIAILMLNLDRSDRDKIVRSKPIKLAITFSLQAIEVGAIHELPLLQSIDISIQITTPFTHPDRRSIKLQSRLAIPLKSNID